MMTTDSGLSNFLINDLGIHYDLAAQIIPFFQPEQFDKDIILTRQGQVCQKLYYLKEGFIRFYSHSDRKPVTHWIFRKGQLVTDVASFYLHEPAKWNIQTLTDCHLEVIHSENYQRLRKVIPQWDNHEKLLLVRLMSALENRVYTFLSMSAEERFSYLMDANPEMFNQLPLQYISSMLGMTAETLSRIRRKMHS